MRRLSLALVGSAGIGVNERESNAEEEQVRLQGGSRFLFRTKRWFRFAVRQVMGKSGNKLGGRRIRLTDFLMSLN